MIRRDIFEKTKQLFGHQASWAIWGPFGERPKDNMDDLSIFLDPALDITLREAHTRFVLVGLNISTSSIKIPLSNFHGKNGEVYKLRYACASTPLWGSYMTDILKDYPDSSASRVAQSLKTREGAELEVRNVESFKTELEMVGAESATLIALGDIVHQILQKHFADRNSIIKVPHYGYRVTKDVYLTMFHKALSLTKVSPSA
jgi:hypothetical protein